MISKFDLGVVFAKLNKQGEFLHIKELKQAYDYAQTMIPFFTVYRNIINKNKMILLIKYLRINTIP